MTEINEISEIIKKDNLRTILIVEEDSYFQKKLIDYLEENIPRDIYSSKERYIKSFLVQRNIASKAKNRKKVKELIITNYKI